MFPAVNCSDQLTFSANDLESLIKRECRRNRSLTFSRFADAPPGNILICIKKGETVEEFIPVSVESLLQTLPGYQALDESVFHFSDMPGYRPNDEWYDSRNDRLEIGALSEDEIMVADFTAGIELIISYANSTGGMAVVEKVSTGTMSHGGIRLHASGFLLSLVFLGKLPGLSEESWFEEILIPTSKRK